MISMMVLSCSQRDVRALRAGWRAFCVASTSRMRMKAPHDVEAHFDGPRRIEQRSGHERAVLREGEGARPNAIDITLL